MESPRYRYRSCCYSTIGHPHEPTCRGDDFDIPRGTENRATRRANAALEAENARLRAQLARAKATKRKGRR